MQGQGCKICPHVDLVKAQQPHERATREDLKRNVTQSQQSRIHGTSACQILFEKPLALYRAYLVHGCLAPVDMSVAVTTNDNDGWVTQNERSCCGHEPKLTCNGQLISNYDHNGTAFVW